MDTIHAALKDVTLLSTFVRLALAALMGGLIGMERGRKRRAAGLRTHMLVCLGAALVMITNQYIVREFGGADPSRLGAQVISGIGFLGVGTIIVDRHQKVRGLTTAAGLWACACMGLALGIGFYEGAIITCMFIIVIITTLNTLEHRVVNKTRTMDIYTAFEDATFLNRFLANVIRSDIKVYNVEMTLPRGDREQEEDCIAAVITIRLPKNHPHDLILEQLASAPGLLEIEEEEQ